MELVVGKPDTNFCVLVFDFQAIVCIASFFLLIWLQLDTVESSLNVSEVCLDPVANHHYLLSCNKTHSVSIVTHLKSRHVTAIYS